MKRILSFVLVLAMLFSFAVPASATEILAVSMTADKTQLEKGETIVLTLSPNKTVEDVGAFTFYVKYNTEKFAFDAENSAAGETYAAATVDDIPANGVVAISGLDTVNADPFTFNGNNGEAIATVAFTAKETVETDDELVFSLVCEAFTLILEGEEVYKESEVTVSDPITVTIVAEEEPTPVDPHTDAISSTLTENITVDGSTVTLKYTGLTPEDGLIPFTITVPAGVDAAAAQLKNSKGAVGALNAKNLEEGARVVKYNVTNGSTAAYQLDWDGDDNFDLTVILDVSALHTAHAYGEATCVAGPTCTYDGCEATNGEQPNPEAHNYSEETGKCTNKGCEAVMPGFNDVTVWTGVSKQQYSNLDFYVTEWYIEDGRDFVLGSVVTYDESTPYGNTTTSTFVDADKVGIGSQVKLGAVIGGDDAETGFKEITGNVGTIQDDNYFDQLMRVNPTDNYGITNTFSFYRVGTLALADVTMLDTETPTLNLTCDTLDSWDLQDMGHLVQWSSDAEDVVDVVVEEVNEWGIIVKVPKLIAKGPGTATITAKIGNEYVSKTATCTVTVECAHDWSKKDGVCAKTDCGYECTHDWKDATCMAPKTCAICSLTAGNVSTEHNYGKDGKCTVDGCNAEDPRANDHTVWTGKLKSQYSNLDLYVSEWYIEDGKPFVLGTVVTYEYPKGGSMNTSTFVDADQVAIGSQVKLGAVIEGEDKANVKEITGTVGTIQNYNYFTQSLRVTPTDYNSIQNFFSVYRVGTLALADVTMMDNETADLTLTDSDKYLTDNWALKYLGNLVEWTSSDESVVKVVAEQRELYGNKYMVGKLVPQGPGTATITAKIGNDTIFKTATCTVTVNCNHDYINGFCDKCGEPNPDYVAISEITLSSNTETVEINVGTEETPEMVQALPLTVGASEKLIATLNAGANQGITWTTSAPNVATVEDGVVTAKGVGTAYITATAGGRDVMTTFAMLAAEGEEEPVSATFPVIVSAAPASGYTVTMGEDQKVAANTAITVPVTLGHADGTTKYNAFDITLSYPAGLTLTSTELEGFDVTIGEGTVRVKGYGEARDAGTAPFSLTFEATAIGTYAVEVTAAKIDSSNGSIDGNAPDAGIIDGITHITVAGYDVQLPEGFTGDSTTAPGQDYTFTAPTDNYNYDVTITIDGEEVEIEPVNGKYTIPADMITGAIVVTAVPSAKTFDVTIPAEHFPGAATEATYGVDYSATLDNKINVNYDIDITIGGKPYTGYTMDGAVLTIPGKDITGEIVITVVAEENGQGGGANMRTITFQGETGVAPSVTASIIDGGTYTFSLKADAMEAGYTYTVMYNGEALTPENGVYSIGPVETNITVTIEKTLSAETTVEVSDYVNKSTGMVKLVKVNGTLAEGKVFAYNGNKMFWVEQYEAWAYLDVASGTDAFTADTAKAKLTTVEGTKEAQTIAAGYDVNKSGEVDINDAQLAYDIYKADMYTDVTAENATVSVEKFLRADVNNTGSVDTSDAAAAVSQIQ